MDNWVLVGPSKLERQRQRESAVGETQVKIKVTHVLLSNYDAYLYSTDDNAYPKTIGRVAIGVVTDVGAKCYGVKKGARVYLNPMRPCGKCYACKSGNRAECSSVKIAGKHFDGFLRDFVVCDYTDVTVIPDSVDDLHALCIEFVALAENIFDQLNLSTGSTVAIVGGAFLGSIMSQIAFYYKLVPIVIDNNPQNLERLKRSGAFFSFAADDNLAANIDNATSSKLCDAAIYVSCTDISPTIATKVLKNKADLIIGGFRKVNFPIDTEALYEKGVRIYAVSDGYGYTESAMNMLVHGAIDLSNFEKVTLKEFDPSTLLVEREKNYHTTSKMTVLQLIM
ncbi:MAG: zinc-binding dehydrogenase [Clostridia bacterium]|nr:zinc-binding dehydrogenase [Clostridia bacterium]